MRSKIFCIGLSKTGTTSVEYALKEYGFSVISLPNRLSQIRRYDAATDISVALNFEKLDRVFPGSRFIYTVREMEGWLRSCEKMWRRRQAMFDASPFVTDLCRRVYGTTTFDEALFRDAYERHDRRVRSFFEARPQDLLIFDIEKDGRSWERFAAFLGRPAPPGPFPRVNTSAGVDRLIAVALTAIPDPEEVARICLLPKEEVERVRKELSAAADGGPLPDPDPGWETDLVFGRLCEHLGGVAALKEALPVDPAIIDAWAERAGAGRPPSLFAWLYNGIASRLGISTEPVSAVF